MTETARGDAPAEEDPDEDQMVEGGPWAALVVLVTATALFFATFALIYFLSSTFRADPPLVGTSASAGGTATPPAGTIDIPVLPAAPATGAAPAAGTPPAGTVDIPVLPAKPVR